MFTKLPTQLIRYIRDFLLYLRWHKQLKPNGCPKYGFLSTFSGNSVIGRFGVSQFSKFSLTSKQYRAICWQDQFKFLPLCYNLRKVLFIVKTNFHISYGFHTSNLKYYLKITTEFRICWNISLSTVFVILTLSIFHMTILVKVETSRGDISVTWLLLTK